MGALTAQERDKALKDRAARRQRQLSWGLCWPTGELMAWQLSLHPIGVNAFKLTCVLI